MKTIFFLFDPGSNACHGGDLFLFSPPPACSIKVQICDGSAFCGEASRDIAEYKPGGRLRQESWTGQEGFRFDRHD